MRSELIYLAIAVLSVLAMFVFVRWGKKSSRRHGWDAYWDGLRRNSAWGDDICEGWDAAACGEPRP